MEICLFYQRVYEEIPPSSILMSRFKNVACVPLCSSFSFTSHEYMHLGDFENSLTSMNGLVTWYL